MLERVHEEHGGPKPEAVAEVETEQENKTEKAHALICDAFTHHRFRYIVHVLGVFEKLDDAPELEQFKYFA